MQGLRDALGNGKARFSDEQVQEILTAFQSQAVAAEEARMSKLAEENKAKGAAYLDANGKREGVTTLDSGLQYEVMKAAEGPAPKATDTVKVHYSGTLIDGTKFDSSYDRGTPAVFPLDGVIRGWTEGLQKMQVGSKYRFVIPSELAYGANPRPGGPIDPNAVLVFEVELLGIEKQ
jgi:FKBP-type peptidyl-prolyl cis-trans isomerase